MLKKDSVETILSNEVLEKNKTESTHIGSFSIVETGIPEKILEQMLSKYSELKAENFVAQ